MAARVTHRLDLVFALHQQVQQLLGVDRSFSVVTHQANEGSVPLVSNLGEGGTARRHQNLADTILKALHGFVIDSQEGLGSPLFGEVILQTPHAILVGKAFCCHPDLWQNSHLQKHVLLRSEKSMHTIKSAEL